MANPTPQRAQAARDYLDMLGIRPRRRPAVQIGRAQVEAPDETDRALELLAAADARARGPQDAGQTEIPPEWSTSFSPESQQTAAAERGARERAAADEQRATEARDAARAANRSRAYDESLIEGLIADSNYLDAIHNSVSQGLTFGLGDEIAGAGRSLTHGTSYEDERDRMRAQQDKSTREAPMLSAAGEVLGSLPYMLIPGAGPGASLTRRALTTGATGMGLGALSGSGHSRADFGSAEYFGDTARDAAIGGVAGVGTELGAAALRRAWNGTGAPPPGTPRPGGDFTPEQVSQIEQRMDAGDPDLFQQMTTREALENEAAIRRVRSTADNASLVDTRRAGDYSGPGGEGYRGFAQDLNDTGISPRGSITRSRTAQERAAQVRNQAGREIGAVRSEMAGRVRSPEFRPGEVIDDLPPGPRPTRAAESVDDDVAQALAADARGGGAVEEATGGARGGRQRPRGVSALDRADDTVPQGTPPQMDPVPRDPRQPIDIADEAPLTAADSDRLGLETRAEINRRADPALVRYSGDVMRMDPQGRVSYTPANTAARLRAEAYELAQVATLPEQQADAAQLRRLADEIDALPPESYAQAQRRLSALDEQAQYGRMYPNAPDAPGRVERARSARGGVRADMDEAVRNTLGEDALQRYQAARGRFGVARATGRLREAGAEREASNLQLGLNDTLAVQGGLNRNPDANFATRAWNAVENVVVNRYLRGNLHSAGAALREFQSDAMAREIVRRLGEQPVTQPMARALAEAQRRGPRAFGVALVTLGRQSPEVQATATSVVQQSPDWQALGLPTAEDPIDTEVEGSDVDWGALGLPTADDFEEEQRR